MTSFSLLSRARELTRQHDLTPAAGDRIRVHLLLIDVQNDFCQPDGALYVGGRDGSGAVDDCQRLTAFLGAHVGRITEITCTLDSHRPHQIFFASFWRGADGEPLSDHSEIDTEMIQSGDARPNPELASWLCGGDYQWLVRQAEFYCRSLEEGGRYRLYLWPEHCLLGAAGHNLVESVRQSVLLHAYSRGASPRFEMKGMHPLTESYSVFAPEVTRLHDGRTIDAGSRGLLEELLAADMLIVAGQASSHCVAASVEHLLEYVERTDPSLSRKVYLMTDCMSAVAVPDPDREGEFVADFTGSAKAAFARFEQAGMRLVESSVPIWDWPGAPF